MTKLSLLGLTLIVLCGSSAARAADMPVKAAPVAAPAGWTGFYAGINAGYGAGTGEDAATPLPFGPPPGANEVPFTYDHKLSGWLGGVQLGYNWQRDHLVLGLETDIDNAGIKGDGIVAPLFMIAPPIPTAAGSFQTGHEGIRWLGTLRGRVGAAAGDTLMIYGTGGLAYGRIDLSEFNVTFPGIPVATFAGTQSTWRAGWTAGAGAEWAIAPQWTAKAEFLHFDLGSTTLLAMPVAPNSPFAVQSVVKTSGNLFRLGVNLRFY